ncbi:hypothetical protein N9B21_01575 [Verrucomicrobiales bacterium]|nr:hypothetical protein [Verrucomicrobiales bacterium]MDA7926708.1 hypothetical protein [Verrucomicrobiales bacterium]
MKGNSIFPVSHLSNQMGMTGLLVGIGLLGNAQLAADIAIVQGAALALFFGFSGNARSVILKPGESTGIRSMLITRLVYLIRIAAQGDRNEEGAPFVCDEDPSPTDPCGISNAEAEDCLTNHLPEPGLS